MISKSLLKSVIIDNRSEISQTVVQRRDYVFDNFNYVLVGVRRAGKSYLLYQLILDYLKKGTSWDDLVYLNFEDDRLIGMDIADLDTILEVHAEISSTGQKPILFLDEIQNIESWEKFARRLADSKYRVYITGSNAKMLSSEIMTTLGARYLCQEVFPFDFEEFLRAKKIKPFNINELTTRSKGKLNQLFNEYLEFGGFPECLSLTVKRSYLSTLYQKIFLSDIAERNNITNRLALRILFKKLAESVKQPISYNRLTKLIKATGLEIGTSTIINYINYAKDACLIYDVENFTGKLVDKETNPKHYFIDNGILKLLHLDPLSSQLENLVAITLLKRYGTHDAVFFYNDKFEVDFYVPEKQLAIQITTSLGTPDSDTYQREVDALVKFNRRFKNSNNIILTLREEPQANYDDKIMIKDEETESVVQIKVLPIWKWLLEKEI